MDKSIYSQPWSVYIAECCDKTFYVGVAKDVTERIRHHNSEKRCRYTRIRKPIVLKYQETCLDYNSARKREAELKRFNRDKKLKLIRSGGVPKWS